MEPAAVQERNQRALKLAECRCVCALVCGVLQGIAVKREDRLRNTNARQTELRFSEVEVPVKILSVVHE